MLLLLNRIDRSKRSPLILGYLRKTSLLTLETVGNIEKVESSAPGSQTVESTLIYEEVTSALETPQILETAPEKSVFEKYLLQFQYDPKTELAFIYQEGETELFQSVLLIAKYALRHMRIPSPFAEDSDFIYFNRI